MHEVYLFNKDRRLYLLDDSGGSLTMSNIRKSVETEIAASTLLRGYPFGATVRSALNHLLEISARRPSLCMAVKSLSTSARRLSVGRLEDLSKAAARFS